MPYSSRALRIVLVAIIALGALACDPPHFAWPERIPDLPTVDATGPTPLDHWIKARRAEPHPTLVAGAAIADLTPPDPQGTYIAGYMPNKKAKGVHTPITGRVLLLDDGRETLVVVTLDFVGFMNDRVWDVRYAASREHPEAILVASTHTHAGPDTLGLWGSWAFYAIPVQSGIDENYMALVRRRLAEAIWRAAAGARPAALYAAAATVPEGVSENAHRVGWKDNELTVLQARDAASGVPIGTLVNYACHGEFLGQNNDELSADFPAFVYAELEKREGGVALFANGALGGLIVPALPRRTENYVRLRKAGAERAGRFLAALASRSLANAERLDASAIRIQRKVLALPMENELFQYLGEKGYLTRAVRDGRLFTEMWRVDIGAFGLVTAPGELFPSLGFAFKAAMPARYKMVMGLANDELGYIMTDEEWDEYLYEYERTVSVGRPTGPALLETLKALYPEAAKQAATEP